jgi:hypothetical protein
LVAIQEQVLAEDRPDRMASKHELGSTTKAKEAT